MRQHNFIFDVDNQMMGVSRASCNEDPNQILSEHDLILAGQVYGLDPNHTPSVNETCDHMGSVVRPPRKFHEPNPQPREGDDVEDDKLNIEDRTDDIAVPDEMHEDEYIEQHILITAPEEKDDDQSKEDVVDI